MVVMYKYRQQKGGWWRDPKYVHFGNSGGDSETRVNGNKAEMER